MRICNNFSQLVTTFTNTVSAVAQNRITRTALGALSGAATAFLVIAKPFAAAITLHVGTIVAWAKAASLWKNLPTGYSVDFKHLLEGLISKMGRSIKSGIDDCTTFDFSKIENQPFTYFTGTDAQNRLFFTFKIYSQKAGQSGQKEEYLVIYKDGTTWKRCSKEQGFLKNPAATGATSDLLNLMGKLVAGQAKRQDLTYSLRSFI